MKTKQIAPQGKNACIGAGLTHLHRHDPGGSTCNQFNGLPRRWKFGPR